jgi:hypothetical protein
MLPLANPTVSPVSSEERGTSITLAVHKEFPPPQLPVNHITTTIDSEVNHKMTETKPTLKLSVGSGN